MTKKITPSLSSDSIKPAGKNFKARIVVWVLLVCVVTGVIFAIRQRRSWAPAPQRRPVPVAKKDTCSDRLTLCQQEKSQLLVRIREAQNSRTPVRTFELSIRLAQQLATGLPFSATLSELQGEVPTQKTLVELSDHLSPYTQQGVPTIAQLQQRLAQIIQQQTTPVRTAPSTAWYDKVWNYVRTMVTVRPTQFSNCKQDACRLAKAQQELKEQRLTAAIKTLADVTSTAAVSQLLEDMKARAFVSDYLAQFTSTQETAP